MELELFPRLVRGGVEVGAGGEGGAVGGGWGGRERGEGVEREGSGGRGHAQGGDKVVRVREEMSWFFFTTLMYSCDGRYQKSYDELVHRPKRINTRVLDMLKRKGFPRSMVVPYRPERS